MPTRQAQQRTEVSVPGKGYQSSDNNSQQFFGGIIKAARLSPSFVVSFPKGDPWRKATGKSMLSKIPAEDAGDCHDQLLTEPPCRCTPNHYLLLSVSKSSHHQPSLYLPFSRGKLFPCEKPTARHQLLARAHDRHKAHHVIAAKGSDFLRHRLATLGSPEFLLGCCQLVPLLPRNSDRVDGAGERVGELSILPTREDFRHVKSTIHIVVLREHRLTPRRSSNKRSCR